MFLSTLLWMGKGPWTLCPRTSLIGFYHVGVTWLLYVKKVHPTLPIDTPLGGYYPEERVFLLLYLRSGLPKHRLTHLWGTIIACEVWSSDLPPDNPHVGYYHGRRLMQLLPCKRCQPTFIFQTNPWEYHPR